MSLKIRKKEKGNCEILKLIGEASASEVYKLSKALEEARQHGYKRIAVDVSESSLLDSSALGVLILNLKILKKEEGGNLYILKPQGYILNLLQQSNLESLFPILNDEGEI